MSKSGIKNKLIKVIPNHKDLPSVNIDSFEFNGTTYIIWGAYRDNRMIWIDMESDDSFGQSMRGRYYMPYEDIMVEFYPYILKSLGID